MTPADPRSDAALVLAVASGDPAAAEAFRTRHAATLARICASVTPADARSRADMARDLASVNLAALFTGFRGGDKWQTFVDAALLDRVLFPRMLARLARDPVGYAHEFEAFFRHEIGYAVRSPVEGRELREDAAQWIWEQLLDNEGRRLETFAREAQTQGFVIVKLRLLARDFLNSKAAPAEGRRRTLPEALAGAPAFDQDVYKQFYWRGAETAGIALLALRWKHPEATEAGVRDARARTEEMLRARGVPLLGDRKPKVLDDHLIDTLPGAPLQDPFVEAERGAFRRAVLAAAIGWSAREQLCLLKRLEGKATGVIAREMGIPNAEAYELMRKVVEKLRKALISHPAARAHVATVTGKESYLDLDRTPAAPEPRTRQGTDR